MLLMRFRGLLAVEHGAIYPPIVRSVQEPQCLDGMHIERYARSLNLINE